MDLIGRKRLLLKNDKMEWIAYDTNFVDPLDGCITIYCNAAGSCFTDYGYTKFNLDCFVPNWREKGVVEKICKRYGCKMKDDNEEIQAPHEWQLVQAIIAIYAWIEFTE